MAPQEPTFRGIRNNNLKQYELKQAPQVSCEKTQDIFNLTVDQMPMEFREPFIVSGYRKPYVSAWECLVSLITRCNECINVWSHVLATILFILCYCKVFLYEHNPLEDPFVYPLLAFAIAVSAMFLMSSGAHLFNSMSPRIRHICFFFDYAAISTYTFTAGQIFFFYSRPEHSSLAVLNSSTLFLGISALLAFVTTALCCASRHRWRRYKHVIRTVSFTVTWVFNTFPYTWRMASCTSQLECHAISKPYFMQQVWCFGIAAFFNACKLPERFIPRVFDFFGQSHHFLHILCAIGAGDDFTTVLLDMEGRRQVLEKLHSVTFANSLGLMALVLIGNIVIVLLFARTLGENHEEEHHKDC